MLTPDGARQASEEAESYVEWIRRGTPWIIRALVPWGRIRHALYETLCQVMGRTHTILEMEAKGR